MIKLLSDEIEKVINDSWVDASERKQEYLLLENILLKSLENETIKEMFQSLNIDIDLMKNELISYLDNEVEHLKEKTKPKQTTAFKKILQDMIFHSQSSGKISQIEDLVLAIIKVEDSMASYILLKHGVDEFIIKEISTELRNYEDEDEIINEFGIKENNFKKKNVLEQYATNLTNLAKSGKLDPIVGRDEETERTIQILCRKKKNNPLLVGQAGVGKTSIIEKLAQDIVNGNVPKQIKDWEVYSIDTTAMIAGAKYRGDFEKRLQSIVKELDKKGNVIAFIDEFHTIFGLGASSSNQLDATNILKPVLMDGRVKIVGATTYEEAQNTIDKNKAMLRRFQKINVEEPDEKTTLEILKGIKGTFENYHNVEYSDEILEKIVSLSSIYLNETHFPDKAIDILDEVGSIIKLKNENQNKTKKIKITEKDIVDLVSKKARVPIDIEEGDEKNKLVSLEKNIKSKLYGQDESVEKVVEKIILSKAGLNETNKPMGAFLAYGPSGVGKTELARLLSENLGLKLLRYDMSEFMEEASVSKMTGASQGYVGYEEGGRLVNDIKQNPHSILLLDEIEKAHPKIQNIFLQILEEAELTASDGTKADFKNVLILFTTNAGSKISKTVGFSKNNINKSKSIEIIDKRFPPEFRNRLDDILEFKPLEEEQIVKVAKKFIDELSEQLVEKNVKIEISDQALKYLSEKGFDSELGARPMKRVIQDLIKKPIAKEIVFGKLINGGSVKIDIDKNNKLKLSFRKTRKK
jgi:ATP-dependent Clp protease ATP-binding subunit ClpA